MDTDDKLDQLKQSFPAVGVDVLLEILVACDGRLKGAESLLGMQFEKTKTTRKATPRKEVTLPKAPKALNEIVHTVLIRRKRPLEVDDQDSVKFQSSLSKINPVKKARQVQTTSKSVTLYTAEEIEGLFSNLVYIRNFLPGDVADKMLDILITKRPQFRHNEFYIAGQKCVSSHYTTLFKKGVTGRDSFESLQHRRLHDFFPELKLCAYEVEDKVNEILSSRPREHPCQISQGWEANLCVANLFENSKQMLDWHSDKLTTIGPLPTIASLTVGATRLFRLKKTYGQNAVTYNIPLPHNTLLVMLPGTQEEYKHCVPALDGCLVDLNPRSGETRFNLTFRMTNPDIIVPQCPKCRKSGMVLKRIFKNPQQRGIYFWMCASKYSGYACPGFYYARFDRNGSSNYTTNVNDATRWIADDDIEAQKWARSHPREELSASDKREMAEK